MKWINEHHYAVRATFKRFVQQPFSSFLNWLVMSFVLSVPLIGWVFMDFLNPLIVDVRSDPQVMVFMQFDATNEQVQGLHQWLNNEFKGIFSSVEHKSKVTALQEMQAHEQWRDVLTSLPKNPFPDAFILITHKELEPSVLDQVITKIKEEPLVESILADQEWIQRLDAINNFARTAFVFLTAIVMVGVSITVFNTVRMQALSQKKEIVVLRLVGANESFVRRPFIYFGAISCCIAWIVSIALVFVFIQELNDYLNSFVQSYGVVARLELPSIDILMLYGCIAMLLGAFSAMWSIHRTTRY